MSANVRNLTMASRIDQQTTHPLSRLAMGAASTFDQALSLIEAYASVTGSLASPAWVIPVWLFLTPIGLAATFVLGCWVACLRRDASAIKRASKKPES